MAVITDNYIERVIEAIEDESDEIKIAMYLWGTGRDSAGAGSTQVLYALQGAIARGVRISAIVEIPSGASLLAECGIDTKVNTGRRLHAKLFLFSDSAIVGSHNMTDRGLLKNKEISYQFSDFESLEAARFFFDECWQSS